MASSLEHARPTLRAVPRGICALGLVSLFWLALHDAGQLQSGQQ
ncbi:MAG TPA: hypothetical protein VF322_03910 [Gammaproteobacteria bacterium]